MGFKFKIYSLLNKGSTSNNDTSYSKPLETFQYINEFSSQLELDQSVFSFLSNSKNKYETDLVFENIKKIFFEGDSKKTEIFIDYLSKIDLTKRIVKYLLLNGPYSHLNLFIDFLRSDFLFYRENGKLFCNIKIEQLVVCQNAIKAAPVDVSIDLEWKDGAFTLSTANKLIKSIGSEEKISFLTFKKVILLKFDKIIANKKFIDKFSQLRYLSESKFEISERDLLKAILAWMKKVEETKEAEIIALPIDNLRIIYYIADIAHIFLKNKLNFESKTLIKAKLCEFMTEFNFLKNYQKKSIEEIENFLLSLKKYINDPQDNDLSGLRAFQIPKEGFFHKAMNAIRAVRKSEMPLRTSQVYEAHEVVQLPQTVTTQAGSNSLDDEPNMTNERDGQDKKLKSEGESAVILEQDTSLYKEQEVTEAVVVLEKRSQTPETPAGYNESYAFLGGSEDKKLLPDFFSASYSPKSDVLSKAILEKYTEAERILNKSLNTVVNANINPDYNYSPRKFFEFLQAITLENASDMEVKMLLEEFFKSFQDMKEKLISAMEYYVAQHYALAGSIDYYNDFYYFERSRGVSFSEENVFAKEKKLGELKLNDILKNIVLLSFSLISVRKEEDLSLSDFFLKIFNKTFNDKFFKRDEIKYETKEKINSDTPSFIANQLSFIELLQCNFDKISKEVSLLNKILLLTTLPISFFERLRSGIFLGEKRLTLLKESIYRDPAEDSYEEKVTKTIAQLKNLTRFKLFFKYRIFFWSQRSKEAVFDKINKCLISSIYEEKLNRVKEAKCDLEKYLRQYNNTLKESQSIANNFVKLVGILNPLIAYPIPQHLCADSPKRLTKEQIKEMIATVEVFTLPMSFYWKHCLRKQEKEINDHIKKLETRKDMILNYVEKLFRNLKKTCSTEESSNTDGSTFSTRNGLGFFSDSTVSGIGDRDKAKIIYPRFNPK